MFWMDEMLQEGKIKSHDVVFHHDGQCHNFHVIYDDYEQSVTSRLETSRYRYFSQFFESIGLGQENLGLEKKSRYRSRKYLVSKKSLSISLENIWFKKSLGMTHSQMFQKVESG